MNSASSCALRPDRKKNARHSAYTSCLTPAWRRGAVAVAQESARQSRWHKLRTPDRLTLALAALLMHVSIVMMMVYGKTPWGLH